MSGRIVPGDAKRFEALLAKEGPSISGVALRSPGGDVDEAMRIGRIVRAKLLRTLAPISSPEGNVCMMGGSPEQASECVCLSSCFLIYAGGVMRGGNVLGLHRPRYDEAFFANLPLEAANRRYGAVIERIKAYLLEMGIGDRYLDRMLRVSSSEMEILSKDEADRDLNGFIPAMAEWLKAKCGEIPEKEQKAMSSLTLYMALKDMPYSQLDDEFRAYVADMSRRVTPEMERRYQAYSRREGEVTGCRNGALLEERRKRHGEFAEFDELNRTGEKPGQK
ncbi:COG3904 family protein [Microvirga lotononidis]|nr:hypothetical protein [Microvirga lotononidis]WQO31331.1 hypothetical protein U0023_34150 [Microvirga lotononidis]